MADTKPLIEFAAKELGISEAEIIITRNDRILNNFSTRDLWLSALLYKAELPGVYNLIVRERQDVIICHELVHLKQYIDGRLSIDMNSKSFIWEGARYSCDTPYEARPWEAEAREKQWPLLRSYRKYQRRINKSNKA